MNQQKAIFRRRADLTLLAAIVSAAGLAQRPDRAWAASGGAIADAVGDSISHDVISTSATFNSTNMYLQTTFQSGTFAANYLAFIVFFDLDQNSTTGTQSTSSISLGADVALSFNSIANPAQARIRGDFVPVSFGADWLSVALPLAVLGDDGHANFSFVVGDPTSQFTFLGRDYAPDSDLGGPLTTPTLQVPEPTTGMLVALGLICLFLGVVRAGDA